jgi:arylsulfatase A-like enzyme
MLKSTPPLLCFSGLFALLFLLCAVVYLSIDDDPPNVVFIIIDDLNTEVGFLGDEQALTPHLDALAQSSVVFEAAYAQAPVCNASRTSFLTGLQPSTTGVYGLTPDFWALPEYDSHPTLPGYFRAQGYHTGAVGKIFQTHTHQASFDFIRRDWFGAMGPFPPEPLVVGTQQGFHRYVDWGPFLTEEDTADYRAASAAIDFIQVARRDHKDVPFFLALGFFRPHVPLYAPQKFFDLHSSSVQSNEADHFDVDQIPPFGQKLIGYEGRQILNKFMLENNHGVDYRVAYRASVSLVDQQIGRVLQFLDSAGLADNTIVAVLSDHGVQNGQKNLWFKRTLWESTARVPLLLRAPDYPAQRLEETVGLIDLFPTLVDIADLPPVESLEGVSLTRWLREAGAAPTAAAPHPPVLTVHSPGSFALTDRRWRYIQYADGSEELYDRSSDPRELTNIADDESRSATISATLAHFRAAAPSDFRDFAPGTSGLASGVYPDK